MTGIPVYNVSSSPYAQHLVSAPSTTHNTTHSKRANSDTATPHMTAPSKLGPVVCTGSKSSGRQHQVLSAGKIPAGGRGVAGQHRSRPCPSFCACMLPCASHSDACRTYLTSSPSAPCLQVNNNCSTGSTALFLAKQLIEGGQADCIMALGFEKMQRGSLGSSVCPRALIHTHTKHHLHLFF